MNNNRYLIFIGLLSIVFLIIFVNLFPHLFALWNTPKDMVFSGQASWFDPWDVNVYVSAIRSGGSHGLLLPNLYTTIPNDPIIIYPLYTIVGTILGRSIDAWILYYSLTAICSFMVVIGLYLMAKIFIQDNFKSLIAVLLTVIGGGFGWMVFPVIQSADLYVTGFTFVSQFQRPHEAVGMMLYIAALLTSYSAVNSQSKPKYFLTLIFIIGTVILYPYYAISILLIFGIWTVIRYIRDKRDNPKLSIRIIWPYLTIVIIVTIVTVSYYLHVRNNPTFSSVVSQILPQPSIVNILLGYGVIAVVYLVQLWKGRRNDNFYFLNIWVIVSLILSLIPLGFTRFYMRGLYLPIIILTIVNIDYIARFFLVSRRFVVILLIVLVPISSLFIFYKRIDEVKNINPWYYIDNDEKSAINYFAKVQSANNGVLASYKLGNMIPAYVSIPVYFGHLFQTPDADIKLENIYRFYTNGFSLNEAQTWLNEARICYVIFGPDERSIRADNGLTSDLTYPFLKSVFRSGNTSIFRNREYCGER